MGESLSAPLAEPVPSWVFPPGGYSADEFLQLRGMFVYQLDRQAPDELRAAREMAVRFDDRQVPVPDVIVLTSAAYDRDDLVNHFVVYTYARESAGQYAITGIHHDRLVLSVPYDIEIDLTKVGARPS